LACEAPNSGGLASHCHERLYILEANVNKRREMDRGGKLDNGHRMRVSPIRDTQARMYSLESFESPERCCPGV